MSEGATVQVGDILRFKRRPSLRVRVLRAWTPPNRPGDTFISVQTVKKNNEPDKRWWGSWSGGSITNWEKEL